MRLMSDGYGSGGEPPVFNVARVTYSDSTGFGAAADRDCRAMPVFGPRGCCWSPCEGDSVLIARQNGTDVCIGVLSRTQVEPGEIRFTTPGGAVLHLKNNGEIQLNDTIIPSFLLGKRKEAKENHPLRDSETEALEEIE